MLDLPFVACDRDVEAHRVKVYTHGHCREQVSAKLWCLGLREGFEDRVGQARQPFRPAQLNRELGVIVFVQRAADETASPRGEAGSLNDLVGGTVRGETEDEFFFDCWVVVIGEHDLPVVGWEVGVGFSVAVEADQVDAEVSCVDQHVEQVFG